MIFVKMAQYQITQGRVYDIEGYAYKYLIYMYLTIFNKNLKRDGSGNLKLVGQFKV